MRPATMIKIDAPDAVTIRRQLLEGRIRAEEVVRASLARIEALEPQLHAWAALDPELALAQARAVDRGLDANHLPGLLGGVPLGVKDIFDTADLPTACGSPIYAGRRLRGDGQDRHHRIRLLLARPNGQPPGTPHAPRAARPAARPPRWPAAWCCWPLVRKPRVRASGPLLTAAC